jgi:hypothetical protein
VYYTSISILLMRSCADCICLFASASDDRNSPSYKTDEPPATVRHMCATEWKSLIAACRLGGQFWIGAQILPRRWISGPAKSVGFSGRANDNVEGDDSNQGRRLRHFHIAAEVISPLDP